MCLQSEIYHRVLRIYLRGLVEGSLIKPLRQLLAALVKVLQAQRPEESRQNVAETVRACVSLVVQHEDPSGVKSAMMMLRMLMLRECISLSDLLGYLQDAALSSVAGMPLQVLGASGRLAVPAYAFFYHALQWVGLASIAPAVGHLLFCFCDMSRACPEFEGVFAQPADLWMVPIKSTIAQDESVLEPLERHVLPPLFGLDIFQTIDSLQPDLQRLQDGRMADMAVEDIRFCVLSLKYIAPSETYATGTG